MTWRIPYLKQMWPLPNPISLGCAKFLKAYCSFPFCWPLLSKARHKRLFAVTLILSYLGDNHILFYIIPRRKYGILPMSMMERHCMTFGQLPLAQGFTIIPANLLYHIPRHSLWLWHLIHPPKRQNHARFFLTTRELFCIFYRTPQKKCLPIILPSLTM